MQTRSQHHHPTGSSSVMTTTANKAATPARWRRLFSRALLAAASLTALPAFAQTAYILTTDGKLASVPIGNTAAVSAGIDISGVTMGETLVGIDVRPQTQRLYALGVNASSDTATLYHLSPETGFAAVVGTASSIAFTTDGATTVDFPDPATVGWDIDFNPAVDRVRVVAGSLNFRVNPVTGAPVDGNNGTMSATGTNPDGSINGGSTTVSATAYVNSQPNNGNVTTQYTLDSATNTLFIQNPPNAGTQTLVAQVTLGGSALDFATPVGFDIPPGVNAPGSNMPVASGLGFAVLTVGSTTGLYSIDLTTGQATFIGGVSARSLAIRTELGAVVAMSADGVNLLRFSTTTPGTVTTQPLGAATVGETLVGIEFRPQTGQYYALGINATANVGTLYLVDPQGGQLTVVGTTGQVAYVAADGVTPVDLPDPAMVGYGVDFNPTVDRIRVVTGSGLNFRLNPNTGAPVDGSMANPGINTDGGINGAGVTGVDATAYTNSFAQSLTGGVTTQYTIDSATNALYIQNPPNNGTQTIGLPLTLGGNPLDIASASGFDLTAAVAVATSNSVAKGEGWLAGTVGGVTGLYTVDLQTGATTALGTVGVGMTSLGGLTVATTPSLRVEYPANTVIYDNLTTVDFGNVQTGVSNTQSITIENTGSQTLVYTASTGMSSEFIVSGGAVGAVAPGGSTVVQVTYSPVANGSFTGTLFILNNDATVATFEIALTGESFVPLANDSVAITGGDTRIFVLANDGLSEDAIITSVSDAAIVIGPDGRSLIIPSGYTGTFTYFTNDNGALGRATVTVTAGTPVANPTVFNGLVRDDDDNVVGFASVKLAASGVATVKLSAGTAKVSAKVTFPSGSSTGTVFTSLGYLILTLNLDGTADITLDALGGDITATLGAAVTTATAAKHHIALRSPDAAFPGGGFAVATTSTKGAIKITGTLPDGIAFTGATNLRDNGSFAFFSAVTKGPKPPAFVGGELLTADLVATDVTGNLVWNKLPQLPNAKGLHLDGVSTTLDATGSLYTGAALFDGAGTLVLSGGNLTATETNAVTVTAGVPTLAGSLTAWTGVKAKDGKFKAKVTVPTLTKDVKGSGLYLPKSNSAVGFFPGTSIGGRIQLTVP